MSLPLEPTPRFDNSGRLLDTSGTWAWDEETHDWVPADVEPAAPSDGTSDAAAADAGDATSPAPADITPAVPGVDDTAAAVDDTAPPVIFPPAPVVDEPAAPVVDDPSAPVVDDPSAPVADDPAPTSTTVVAAPVVVPDPAVDAVNNAAPVEPVEPVEFHEGDLVDYAVDWPEARTQTGLVVRVRESDGACSVAWLDAISGPIPAAQLVESQVG